ncbi:hypothetical protein [Streptomyces sp. KR80]|uniref:hypothetical protein n=1 Tax=Streptomyces sp. KR80 TaxID=3457426 RepID=UPI003FD648C8
MTWYSHARNYAEMKWPNAAAKHRASIAESLTLATITLCPDAKGRPEPELLRRALYQWAYNAGRGETDPPPAEAAALAWVAKHSPTVADLDSAQRMRTVLDFLGKKKDGTQAAANTVKRRRAALSNCLRIAVERELLPSNPLLRVHWETPKAVEELDERSVATPAQARALLAAVRSQGERGEHLEAFFGCMYYAALRPEEVSVLSRAQCTLPETGWGRLDLAGATSAGWFRLDGRRQAVRRTRAQAPAPANRAPCADPSRPGRSAAAAHRAVRRGRRRSTVPGSQGRPRPVAGVRIDLGRKPASAPLPPNRSPRHSHASRTTCGMPASPSGSVPA